MTARFVRCECAVESDLLRKHGEMLCVCEIVPLFDVPQPTISHLLKVLHEPAWSRGGLLALYTVELRL